MPGRSRCRPCYLRRQQARNRTAERTIYDGDWARHSAQRRAEEGGCSVCGATRDLTVDHPTDAVLCRTHHGQLEARRRRWRAIRETTSDRLVLSKSSEGSPSAYPALARRERYLR